MLASGLKGRIICKISPPPATHSMQAGLYPDRSGQALRQTVLVEMASRRNYNSSTCAVLHTLAITIIATRDEFFPESAALLVRAGACPRKRPTENSANSVTTNGIASSSGFYEANIFCRLVTHCGAIMKNTDQLNSIEERKSCTSQRPKSRRPLDAHRCA